MVIDRFICIMAVYLRSYVIILIAFFFFFFHKLFLIWDKISFDCFMIFFKIKMRHGVMLCNEHLGA